MSIVKQERDAYWYRLNTYGSLNRKYNETNFDIYGMYKSLSSHLKEALNNYSDNNEALAQISDVPESDELFSIYRLTEILTGILNVLNNVLSGGYTKQKEINEISFSKICVWGDTTKIYLKEQDQVVEIIKKKGDPEIYFDMISLSNYQRVINYVQENQNELNDTMQSTISIYI